MSAALEPGSRGTLFPHRLPVRFRRVPAGENAVDVVSWWWLCEWSLPAGVREPQHVIAFPAANLAVENSMVGLSGPTTRASTRTLEGAGWVVGALLRPAALAALAENPAELRDLYVPLDESVLHQAVSERAAASLEDAIPVVEKWLLERVGTPTPEALLANRIAVLAGSDSEINAVSDLARAVGLSERSLHRLTRRYFGLTPYALIRRRRIQEAAQAIRDGRADLAAIAAEHGFTDQAHLGREFRQILGRSPAAYRAEAQSP